MVGRLQAPLRQFCRTRLQVTSHDDVASSVRRVLDDTHSSMASAVSAANVTEGVDYPETLDNFFVQRLTPLIERVWNSSEEDFALNFHSLMHAFLADLTNLSVR